MTFAAWLMGASLSPNGTTRQIPFSVAQDFSPARSSSGWMAGAARVNITPREPLFMKGYGSRTKPAEGIRQDLYVKALALRDETGATAVLVTSDLHSFTRRAVRDGIDADRTGRRSRRRLRAAFQGCVRLGRHMGRCLFERRDGVHPFPSSSRGGWIRGGRRHGELRSSGSARACDRRRDRCEGE